MISPDRPFSRLVFIAAWALAVSWADRGRAAAPKGHFIYTPESITVLDSKTQLTWERYVPMLQPLPMVSYDFAQDYCANLDFDGSTDWRLPSMKELQTIVDRGGPFPTIDAEVFPSTPGDYFWTSSTRVDAMMMMNVWVVDFAGGSTAIRAPSTPTYARCVRP